MKLDPAVFDRVPFRRYARRGLSGQLGKKSLCVRIGDFGLVTWRLEM